MQMKLWRLNWRLQQKENCRQTDSKLALFLTVAVLILNPFNLNFPVRVWIRATEKTLSILVLHWKYRN